MFNHKKVGGLHHFDLGRWHITLSKRSAKRAIKEVRHDRAEEKPANG